MSDSDFYALSSESEDDYSYEVKSVKKHFYQKAPGAYNFQTKTLTKQQIQQIQKQKIDQVNSVLNLNSDISMLLLALFNWNTENLIDSFSSVDTDAFLEKNGLDKSFYRPSSSKLETKEFYCSVCCENNIQKIYALSCNHEYCVNCHSEYLTMQINDLGSIFIKCMSECKNIYKESEIKLLVSKEPLFIKYENLLYNEFIKCNKSMCFCKGLDCQKVIESNIPDPTMYYIPSVLCEEGHTFCFNCNNEEHSPCPCDIVKRWIKKCMDDSETSNWISVNTKECPKCNSTIEKNGGCNHMTCKQCADEFCWICMGPWKEHGQSYYSCNKFNEDTEKASNSMKSQHRAVLERYLHYYNRYNNHQQSAKMDTELHQRTEKRMDEMQKTNLFSWIDVQFFKTALHVLIESRHSLKWSYVFAYYLQRNNTTRMFEDNQSDLEFAVESLSEHLENPKLTENELNNYKQKVINQTKYVSSRKTILIQDIAKGFIEKKWAFENNTH